MDDAEFIWLLQRGMMAVLYIAGSQKGAGKTALATALAHGLAQENHSVALFKPLLVAGEPEDGASPDRDSIFYQQVLPQNPHPKGWPISVTPDHLAEARGVLEGIPNLVTGAAAGAETTIVEGLDGLGGENPTSLASAALAQGLGARVVALVRYDPSLQPDELVAVGRTFGSSLLGLIINGVPRYRLHQTATFLLPALQAGGIAVLGIIPEDRRMLAPTVGDLAAHLGGEFRLLEEQAEELVESVMTGGWFLDPGDYVFSRRNQKAVIVKADRPDLQMAALKTSTACLVLTGGQNPIQYITSHAELEEVPIILVESSTLEVMEQIPTVADRITVHNPRKVAQFHKLLAQHCDLDSLYAGLGIH